MQARNNESAERNQIISNSLPSIQGSFPAATCLQTLFQFPHTVHSDPAMDGHDPSSWKDTEALSPGSWIVCEDQNMNTVQETLFNMHVEPLAISLLAGYMHLYQMWRMRKQKE